MNATQLLENMVPTSSFSKGQSARCFEKVSDGLPIIVVKNNVPYRVVITPADFTRMAELEEDNELLAMALARLEANKDKRTIPAEEAYAELGIDPKEIEQMDDVELA